MISLLLTIVLADQYGSYTFTQVNAIYKDKDCKTLYSPSGSDDLTCTQMLCSGGIIGEACDYYPGADSCSCERPDTCEIKVKVTTSVDSQTAICRLGYTYKWCNATYGSYTGVEYDCESEESSRNGLGGIVALSVVVGLAALVIGGYFFFKYVKIARVQQGELYSNFI